MFSAPVYLHFLPFRNLAPPIQSSQFLLLSRKNKKVSNPEYIPKTSWRCSTLIVHNNTKNLKNLKNARVQVATHIMNLPNEILNDIFSLMDGSTSFCLSLTCKRLHSLRRRAFGQLKWYKRWVNWHTVNPLIEEWMGCQYDFCYDSQVVFRKRAPRWDRDEILGCMNCGSHCSQGISSLSERRRYLRIVTIAGETM